MLEERRRLLIVPIFIPYQGCPHRCIYCQQEKITDQAARRLNPTNIEETLNRALRSPKFDKAKESEVAFYGGTFTNLSDGLMGQLLEAVGPYIKQGFFKSIRVSTRPDALDGKKLALMRDLHVSTVEVGAQSMDNGVLDLTRRGHSAADTTESVRLLKENGFKVGIQLMPGLPGDTKTKFMKTVDTVMNLSPDMVRIYPTLVIKGTELENWYREGRYQPLSLKEAVRICVESCTHLEENGIPVIRMGLMSSPSLLEEGQIIAGPWHKAFGFLVRSEIHHKRIAPYLPEKSEIEKVRLRAPYREIPLVTGYKNRGLRSIEEKTGAKVMGVIPDDSVLSGQVRVERGKKMPLKDPDGESAEREAKAGYLSGFIAIIGPPNVGKSTLLNRLLDTKVAIVSPKPQTTRNRIRGILHGEGFQMVFIDTPGIHKTKTLLHQSMVSSATAAISEVDTIVVMIDMLDPDDPDISLILQDVKQAKKPTFLLINKIDKGRKERLLPIMDEYGKLISFEAIIPISALKGNGVERLLEELKSKLKEGPPFFPADMKTDQSEAFLVSETVREKIYSHTSKELPYSSAVTVGDMEEVKEKNLLSINATIHVESDSQKAILIGRKGKMIRAIGRSSRLELERIFGTRIFLDLRVRVEKDWSKDPKALRKLGY